mgnify:CR=1 FL=1
MQLTDVSFLVHSALILLGAAISLVSLWVKNLLSRDTHASNRIFELRLEAIAEIWAKYIKLYYEVAPVEQLGHGSWKEQHYEKAEELRLVFRKEIENRQVYIDKEVANHFRKMDLELQAYMDGFKTDKNDRPISFIKFKEGYLKPRLSELSSAVNVSMDRSTHEISLELST